MYFGGRTGRERRSKERERQAVKVIAYMTSDIFTASVLDCVTALYMTTPVILPVSLISFQYTAVWLETTENAVDWASNGLEKCELISLVMSERVHVSVEVSGHLATKPPDDFPSVFYATHYCTYFVRNFNAIKETMNFHSEFLTPYSSSLCTCSMWNWAV